MPGAFACALFFLGWATSFASVLLLSPLCGFFLLCVLPSLGIFSLPRLIRLLATNSSLCFPSLFSLPLVFLLAVLGGPSVTLWPFVFFLDLLPSGF